MVATLLSIFSLFNKNMADPKLERTFIAVKPDGVQRGLVGEIVSRFEKRGYKLVAAKMTTAPEALLLKHYEDLKEKVFFKSLIKYMASGPLFAMVWEGKDVVRMGRMMLGETNPRDSKPGSIRGDYGIDVGRNICHGSDAVESAQREIALWFKDDEISDYKIANDTWIYE